MLLFSLYILFVGIIAISFDIRINLDLQKSSFLEPIFEVNGKNGISFDIFWTLIFNSSSSFITLDNNYSPIYIKRVNQLYLIGIINEEKEYTLF